jgi:hypothetical protein
MADSGAYRQGRQDERERLQHLIDFSIDELAPCHAPTALCAELLLIRQQLEE